MKTRQKHLQKHVCSQSNTNLQSFIPHVKLTVKQLCTTNAQNTNRKKENTKRKIQRVAKMKSQTKNKTSKSKQSGRKLFV